MAITRFCTLEESIKVWENYLDNNPELRKKLQDLDAKEQKEIWEPLRIKYGKVFLYKDTKPNGN